MIKNGRCACCGQVMRWEKGVVYPLVDSLVVGGEFVNTLPEVLGVVTFEDGAKVPCVLSRITESFLVGVLGADHRKVRPVSFLY